MTKANLITEIAIQTGYDKITIANIVESLMSNVKKSCAAGEKVVLRGFGTFDAKQRAEKVARDIIRQTRVVVPAHRVPSFKPSVEFKDAVN